eukprot:NODE_10_length_47437_cov_0.363429.p20 type:complete len:197 gc:universal NODE_10_length_47437_cov_0.363429:25526-26116(+)
MIFEIIVLFRGNSETTVLVKPRMSSDKILLVDSKSILAASCLIHNSIPLIQIKVIKILFHSEIEYLDHLQKQSIKLAYLNLDHLVMTHKIIRDSLADLVHGTDIFEVVNLLSSLIPKILKQSTEVIKSCQVNILQYDNIQVKTLVCYIWNRITEYPKLLNELLVLSSDFNSSEISAIELCSMKFRWMIIDLHVLCQ